MLQINRSEDFWTSIVADPSVQGKLLMPTESFIESVTNPRVTPYSSENGGFLTIELGVGPIVEFHSVFTEKGRGREAFTAACELAQILFSNHDLLVTYETEDPMSRPPLSFGFKTSDVIRTTRCGDLKLWYLTKTQWELSPVFRRITKCPRWS